MADEELPAEPSNLQPKAPSPSPGKAPEKPQVPGVSGLNSSPLMHHVPDQKSDDEDHGPGIYAIPYMGPLAGFDPTTLIPLKYTIPTYKKEQMYCRNACFMCTHAIWMSSDLFLCNMDVILFCRPIFVEGAAQEQGQEGRQQHGPQRQVVVRRFHFEFHLDLTLLMKLAAMVFLFSQDGSKEKIALLVFFASLIYLYQTGAFTPLIRWLQRTGAPPQARPHIQPPNPSLPDPNNPQPEENSGVENQSQNQNQPVENQPQPEGHGVNWWALVKEIQTFVVGFVTSLLPGFHHND